MREGWILLQWTKMRCKMLRELFNEYIELSKVLRFEYPESLGKAKEDWFETFSMFNQIPHLIEVIYSSVQGTKREIKNQKLMDFIPGYYLIHIDEFVQEKKKLDNMRAWPNDVFVIPFMTNYSSDYFCYVQNAEGDCGIRIFLHDEGTLELVHRTPEKFLKTIIEMYKQHVFYLDDDGYLDYDYQKEGVIGLTLNPDVPYWSI